MAMFKVEDAARSAIPLRVALMGSTGSGKSNSALRLALGMQMQKGTGPIVVIDTENRKSDLYCPPPGAEAAPPKTFRFRRINVEPPYHPLAYRDALLVARNERPSVVIVDQVSDEWRGQGGILQMVDESTLKNKLAPWKVPGDMHWMLMNVIKDFPSPIIFCVRAEEKVQLVGGNVVPAGYKHVAETLFPYQMTFSFIVGHEKPGTLSMDRKLCKAIRAHDDGAGVVSEGELATEEVGKRLAAWAAGESLD